MRTCTGCNSSLEGRRRNVKWCSETCRVTNWRKQVGKERVVETWRSSRYRRTYGITAEDYDSMFANQRGKCALCHEPETHNGGQRLAVDHDHASGKVRALLCSRCNTALGNLRDDPALMIRAAAYVATHRR